jgi:hypothetical protein
MVAHEVGATNSAFGIFDNLVTYEVDAGFLAPATPYNQFLSIAVDISQAP